MTTGESMVGRQASERPSARRLWAWLGGVLRRLDERLTSLNARMEGESACRRCGVCHHVCGMLATSRHGSGLPKE